LIVPSGLLFLKLSFFLLNLCIHSTVFQRSNLK
jgi:hypothetical protein